MTSANTNSRVIDVDGVQLYAETRSGTAPALVFLHYWGGSLRTWQRVLTRLRPDQAFVPYDQRGWGDSANAPGQYDMERLADDAQTIITRLGYTDYVLVGHSMGGKVALALAARKPADFTYSPRRHNAAISWRDAQLSSAASSWPRIFCLGGGFSFIS